MKWGEDVNISPLPSGTGPPAVEWREGMLEVFLGFIDISRMNDASKFPVHGLC